MSTAREHMAADLAYVLNDTGEAATEIAIDGTPVRAILTAADDRSRTEAGVFVERRRLWCLAADLAPTPVLGQEMEIGVVTFVCEAATDDSAAGILEISLARYLA